MWWTCEVVVTMWHQGVQSREDAKKGGSRLTKVWPLFSLLIASRDVHLEAGEHFLARVHCQKRVVLVL
jgi:hypothetical protein